MRQRIGNLDFDCASHCVYHLAVHVVFCTKFRRHTLEKRDFLYSIMRQVATHYQREIAEINGEEALVHFLLRYPPTVVLSSLIGAIKSQGASAALDASVLCIGAKIPAPSGRTDSFSAPPAEPRWKFSSSTSQTRPLVAASITYPPPTEDCVIEFVHASVSFLNLQFITTPGHEPVLCC